MSTKTPAQLDAEIKEALDNTLIAEWRAAGGKGKDRNVVPYGSPLYWALSRDDQRKKVAKREAKKGKPVTATGLNLSALAELVANNSGHVRFPNQFNPGDRPHLKRCVDAGYMSIEGKNLALTKAGSEAVADYFIKELAHEQKHPAHDDYYAKRQTAKVAKLEHALATLSAER